MYKLGIDVGGTNTDAVIIDENYNVIAIALGDSPERMLDYAGILSSMRVEF